MIYRSNSKYITVKKCMCVKMGGTAKGAIGHWEAQLEEVHGWRWMMDSRRNQNVMGKG